MIPKVVKGEIGEVESGGRICDMKQEVGPGGFFAPVRGFEKNPNRTPPPGTETAIKVGRLAETAVMQVWTQRLDRGIVERALRLYETLTRRLRGAFGKTLKQTDYQQTMGELPDQLVGDVYEAVFDTTGVNFNFPDSDFELDGTYKAMGAVAALRQIACPDVAFANSDVQIQAKAGQRFTGGLVPNVRGVYGQFDAIMVPKEQETRNGKGAIEFINMGGLWVPFEVKLPLRARYLSGGNGGGGKIRKVFSWDLRQHYDRLGHFLIENQGAVLPAATAVIYLRGILPSVVHVWPFTDQEYLRWYDRLDAEIAERQNNGGGGTELYEDTKEALARAANFGPTRQLTGVGPIKGEQISMFPEKVLA